MNQNFVQFKSENLQFYLTRISLDSYTLESLWTITPINGNTVYEELADQKSPLKDLLLLIINLSLTLRTSVPLLQSTNLEDNFF